MIQGTFRRDRHGREAQPRATGWPKAPRWLTKEERKLWRGLKAHCEAWSAPSDVVAFNGVVSLLDRLLNTQRAMQATETAGSPIVLTADGGESKENPLYTLEVKLWRELRAYIGLTGLSPVDRARMQTHDEPTPPSPLDRFLKRERRRPS